MQFQELVEANGHLIDSHVMEEIFDKVVENNGRFEVEEFTIGRTNGDPSYSAAESGIAHVGRYGPAAWDSFWQSVVLRSIQATLNFARSTTIPARPKIFIPPPTTAP